MPSQSLSLSQHQKLQMTLAPQLRQSLEMLQLPILELRAMVQQEIEQNPTIEEEPSRDEKLEIEPGDGTDVEDPTELQFKEEFEVLAKLDEEWRDYFFQEFQNTSYSSESEERRQFLLDSLPQQESLQEHLLDQLHLAGLSEPDSQIGELIIGSIDENGHLTTDPEELGDSIGCGVEHFVDVLHIIQDFHPTGVGTRNLRECLLLQLDRLDKNDTLAAKIVASHLDKLGGKKYQDLARVLKVSMDEIQEASRLIATLDPKPGRLFTEESTTYVYPEILVHKVDGEYQIIINDDHLPHIRISNNYKRILSDPTTKPEVKAYIQERIRSGAFLIKSIHQRQRTIERIATEIVQNQQEFLEHGVSHLKPMTMSAIADVVGVHETTVSRAVAGKYMKTDNGVYELRYFFTPGIKRADGTQISNKSVKDVLATLVSNEDSSSPLSDQEIVELLKERDITIARRTVAKYRLMLRIPPSHMRKGF